MTFRLFAVTVPGLEPFTRQELAALGIKPVGSTTVQTAAGEPCEEAGGVEFDASLTDLYRANLYLRTPNRILARFGQFYAAAFSELRKKASRLPWEQHLRPGQPVALRVTCHKSRLYHSGGVAERIAGAISDRLGKPTPQVKFDEAATQPPQLIIIRLVHDQCSISVDTSGALLHRRGYRLETAKAPLRETLAAGMLLASGWDTLSPLIDPFCGSGTIPIEAAMLARRIPPGLQRRFAFMDWPHYDAQVWQTIRKEAKKNILPACPAIILASDRDEGAMRIARANAERAGVLHDIQFACQAFSAIQPPASTGWVVTNPPYGIRISPAKDLRNLYSHLGDVLRDLCTTWHAGILCSDDILAGHTRIAYSQKIPVVNGGINVKFFNGIV